MRQEIRSIALVALRPTVTALTLVAIVGAIYIGTQDQGVQAHDDPQVTTTNGTAPSPTQSASSPSQAADSNPADDKPSEPVPPLPMDDDGPSGSRLTTGSHEVALTFDDGPDPHYTPQVLDLLRRHGVTATFCLVGENAQAYPELVRAIAADGHTLCNHSWKHDFRLGSRSRAAIRADLARTNEAIRAAVPDARIAYYRQPGGYWTDRVVAVAAELGMTSLHWTVDPQDWRRPGAGSIAAQVTSGTADGAIVLLHDGGGDRAGTVAALRPILTDLTRRFHLTALPLTPPEPPSTAYEP